mmetsp:Transcript_22547/g.27820  ORF Transcript_22547/g.27820 Transcript_22547/m.27820 type:complete len:137 (+) Transcript_22547:86-496(+)|eukprot:CAMPEP_0172514718 /NCGR_PEP_ID=MMETSP1066-20121228/262205_1 /TAXON_ID=671091 /ORGANISM="Coscinodiscus wailesii, Strain CCMP2513" /LENGTH=136 /DNA_ID=CAMNT_0013295493 /DNA_START=72 /DNA_END=482 /DNA_ORIENTATION=+
MSSSPYLPRVLSGYRRLFRARKMLFTGDERAMRESRIAIRAQFDINKHVTDVSKMEGLMVMIDETEHMLRHGILRGQLDDKSGNYQVKIKPEHAEMLDGQEITTAEPITPEMTKKPDVVVTKNEKGDASGCVSSRS